MLNIGFIGFGKSTTRYHLPYVLIRDSIKVKAIYCRKRKLEKEEEYKEYNINFTENLEDILEDKDIELVSICTPPSTHFELAMECLKSGKNVLVEKPFCTNVKEAKELMTYAKERNLIIMPYQNRRFDSDFLAIKEVINKGALGDIIEIESHLDYFRPDDSLHEGAYYDGALYGLGVHTIDQIISLFGAPNKVFYDVKSIRNNENPDDSFEVVLFYNKVKAIIKTNHLVKLPYARFTMHGSKGSFIKEKIDKQEQCLKANIMPQVDGFGVDSEEDWGLLSYIDELNNDKTEKFRTPIGDYGRVYDNLYTVIKKGQDKLVSDEELLINMKILEDAFKIKGPHIIEFKVD